MLLFTKYFCRIFSFILLFFHLSGGGQFVSAQTTRNIKVKILEKETGQPVPGAVVKCNKQAYVTNVEGCCTIPKHTGKSIVLSVKSLGFLEVVSQAYTIGEKNSLTVRLASSVTMLDQIFVYGQRKQTTLLQQTVALEGKMLQKNASISLAHLLEKLPGVSSISSGNSIAKPVIQGMHSSRILLVNDGVRLESQNWGLDHAPEIDYTGSNVIEVVKGAEAIRYGYGAMGGVVLFNQAPLSYGHEKPFVTGRLNLGYGTNARAYDGSGSIEFAYKKVGIRLHGMYQKAGDYSTAEYILNNTGFRNISLSGLLGFRSRNFTATLSTSLYSSHSGIYYASQISDINQLLARFLAGRPDPDSFYPFSYNIQPPLQQSQHFTVKGDIDWTIHHNHRLSLKLSYQDNLRQEFENRKHEILSWLPVQDLQLTTYNGEAMYECQWLDKTMTSQLGLSGMYQYNYNVPGTKQPAFIPNYAALTTGLYLVQKARFGRLQTSLGIRYDLRALDVDGYTSLSSFKYYDDFKLYYNFTGSLAGYYSFSDQFEGRINVGWAWRPPDINELYATGLHHGTYWVVGNRNLTSERGYKGVLGGRYHNAWLSLEPGFFYQYVHNYIYDNLGKGLDRFHNHPSGKYPKFVYGQDNVSLVGGDLVARFTPLADLTITAKGEWIRANNLSQDSYLPFMPSDRYGLEMDYHKKIGRKKRWNSSLALEVNHVTKQKRFDPEKDLVPDSPDAYTLVNVSAELERTFGTGTSLKFLFNGENVFNTLYKEYTDRFRYYAHARGSNFSFRIIYKY